MPPAPRISWTPTAYQGISERDGLYRAFLGRHYLGTHDSLSSAKKAVVTASGREVRPAFGGSPMQEFLTKSRAYLDWVIDVRFEPADLVAARDCRNRAPYLVRAARMRRREDQRTPRLLLARDLAKRRLRGPELSIVAFDGFFDDNLAPRGVALVEAAQQSHIFLDAVAQPTMAFPGRFAVETEQNAAARPVVEAMHRPYLSTELPLQLCR